MSTIVKHLLLPALKSNQSDLRVTACSRWRKLSDVTAVRTEVTCRACLKQIAMCKSWLPALAMLLLTACGVPDASSHLQALSATAAECEPLTVEADQLSADQLSMLDDAIGRWNSAVGFEALALTDELGDIVVTSDIATGGGLQYHGGVIAIGNAGPEFVYSLAHLLGTALGLPDDTLPGSVMWWTAAPNGIAVLPQHAAALLAMRPECAVTTVDAGGVL